MQLHKMLKNKSSRVLLIKIGSLWCALWSGACGAADIQLRFVSEQGKQISSIAAGTPGKLEVVIPSEVRTDAHPTIDGIDADQIISEQTSQQFFMHNGITTRERVVGYIVAFSDKGSLTIGPARLQTDAGELVSNSVQITVIDPAQQMRDEKKVIHAAWKLAKEKAYILEPIPYELTLYYTDNVLEQVQVRPVDVVGAVLVPAAEVKRGITTYQGIACRSLTWSGILYPQRTGMVHIPSVTFEYQEPAARQQSNWMSFMQLLAPPQKIFRSAATSLHVAALPATQQYVSGVGTLRELNATCSAHTIEQGQTVVYTVEVVGDALMSEVKLPPLVMPDTVRVYDSKVTVTGTYPTMHKTCEYILQALEPGTIKLPAQQYTFFDPKVDRYVQYATEPCTLMVTPAAQQLAEEHEEPLQAAIAVAAPETNIPVPEASSKPATPLPLPLFIILLLVPPVWVVCRTSVRRFSARWQQRRQLNRALQKVLRDVHQAVMQQQAYACTRAWQTFVETLSAHVDLATLRFSETERAAWDAVQAQMHEQAFYGADAQRMQAIEQHVIALVAIIRKKLRERGLV